MATEDKPKNSPDINADDCFLMTRREFLNNTAFVGGALVLGGMVPFVSAHAQNQLSGSIPYLLNKAENQIYSVCLNCHTACTIRAKIQDGLVVKIDGNPYSPMNLMPNLTEVTSPVEAARVDGKLCVKGQAGVQVLYDPYRIRKVLKRVGPRGEGKWVSIDFNKAVDEIVEGGNLFGEGDVQGLADIYKLRDSTLSKRLAADTGAVVSGDMTLEEFKTKNREHLDLFIDPDHPDLGPVNNQFVFLGGRMEHGRKELGKRFTYEGFGSANFFLHTTICEQSHHIAYKEMTLNLDSGKGKTHMKPDFISSEFVIFFGTGAFEANFGPTPMCEMVTDSMVRHNLKFVVVDPRLSKTANKAWKWVPIIPGTDGALALGMIRWIIENDRYDKAYLETPSNAAAKRKGELTSTDATHLIRLDQMVFLKPEDAGLSAPTGEKSLFVVMTEQGAALSTKADTGLLHGEFYVNGIRVKPAFQLLKERALEKTIRQYADICGIREDDIVLMASEFTSHGKKASAELYRGPVQHTNGYYNAQAIITLNILIGNVNHRGGLTTGGSHWHEDGSKKGQPFPKSVVISTPGGLSKFGIHVNRESNSYEKSTLFSGYPAKRPWYPFTNELYQNIIPSAAAGYPYPIKAMLMVKGTPVLATPAGHKQIDMLKDPKKIPLLIACDIVIAETSMYADYIFPDLTFLERWGVPHITPAVLTTVSKVRQPAAPPLTEIVTVDGQEMPISLEAFLIAAAKKLSVAGFGQDALGRGYNFDRPEQYYMAMIANLAFGDKNGADTLPRAGASEMEIFRAARAHLPKSVFDEAVWRAAVPDDLWPSVVTILNRGGRFADSRKAYQNGWIAKKWTDSWHLYVEKIAKGKNSLNGRPFDGLPKVEPITDAEGKEIKDNGYDLTLITYKDILGGQSRTHGAPWVQTAILPENYILMNSQDANRIGLKDGSRARIVSASLPDARFDLGDGRSYTVAGKVKVTEGMRPGTVAVSWSYGHWAYGSNDVEVDGQVVRGDARRASGIVPNPAMRVDPVLGDVCLTDPIGGSASYYDTKIRVEKV
jgi:anaerobic selenocysteine-containing dehydrogenase